MMMGGLGGPSAGAWGPVPPVEQQQYEAIFRQTAAGGYVSGQVAKQVLGGLGAGLPTSALRVIWDLADMDKDGALNQREFVVRLFVSPPHYPAQSLRD